MLPREAATHRRQWVFMLVPQVALCRQQARYVHAQTDIKTGRLFGTLFARMSRKADFAQMMDAVELVVLTGGVMNNLIKSGFVAMPDIALLVLDEAHQARGDHDYVKVMQAYHKHKLLLR